jgi:large subunit ribosomal protein L9
MKVILIKDVARLGRKSEVKDVPDGHALNFLIPKKMAVIATPEQLRRIGEEVKKHGEQHEQALREFGETCELLKTKKVVLAVEANEQGHLFKGINAQDIVKHLGEVEHISLDAGALQLEHPIKALGVHEIPLSYKNLKGVCTLEIVKK